MKGLRGRKVQVGDAGGRQMNSGRGSDVGFILLYILGVIFTGQRSSLGKNRALVQYRIFSSSFF